MRGRAVRVLVTAVGIVFIGAGGFGRARGLGAFGWAAVYRPMVTGGTRAGPGFWALAVVTAGMAVYLGFLWLRSQLGSSRRAVIDHGADSGVAGRTEIEARGAAAALADDVSGYAGVLGAVARIDSDHPLVVDLRVDIEDGAPVQHVRRELLEQGVPRLRQALEVEAIDTRLHVRLAAAGRALPDAT